MRCPGGIDRLAYSFAARMLVMVGHNVHVVSPGKKNGDHVKTAVHDFLPGEQTYAELKGAHSMR